ncbi:hypothetical protein [Alishewanella sp. WH16-1]|uniref:hypothetical protein n=1 Tax=Alishewanella sp. WH16-1 TaxID=1651088 RepID=UPI000A572695|nr:hypothetical protein [Alishewanella sp. WH16-1]
MKYFLLCALVIAGAFFSPLKAQEHNPCPQGGTLLNDMCTMSAPLKDVYVVTSVRHGTSPGVMYTSISHFLSRQTDPSECSADTSYPNRTTTGTSRRTCLTYEYPDLVNFEPVQAQTFNFTRINTFTHYERTCGYQNGVLVCENIPPIVATTTDNLSTSLIVYAEPQQNYQCPPDGSVGAAFTQGPYVTESGQNLCYYPAVPAEPEPECDCANFAGDSLSSFNDLKVPVGTYTKDNPPQCVEQRDYAAGRDEPLRCRCQVSAQKWTSSYGGFKDGVEYETWSTLPTEIGKPSGTFTGVKCGSTDGGPLEPENNAPKDCFTLKNGVKWCWADKAEKCQIVNGVEQCASGCGTVNGDFVCYDDTPVIPPKDRDQLTPPDDTLTEPGKSINDMVKGDFKEINKGVESRLDNVVTSITNNTIAMDQVSDQLGLTNSKLDGIGMQLDGIGKQLGDIDGTLEGAFGDDGEPDSGSGDNGDCAAGECSWYESTYPDGLVGIWQERSAALQQTPMFDFVNQFSFQPSGSQPDMQLCLNIASYANFGCHSIEVPAAVWLFLKVCILFSAAMLCRALIFGG